jgi:hypothetical protein
MQTFLPYSTPADCAAALDNKRLNKQILECYQILKVISTNGKAWRNHPAVLMWEGAENELWRYTMAMVNEANHRGIKTENNLNNLNTLKSLYGKTWGDGQPVFAKTKESFNRTVITHRANLYRKDPIYYAHFSSAKTNKFNKPCCDRCQYYWATHKESVGA